MGSDGEEPRRVAEAGAGGRFLQVQWSPDGRRVAFMKSAGEGNAQSVSVESVDAQSGAGRQIFYSRGLQSFCWTADGQLFLALEESSSSQRDTNLWQASLRADGEMDAAPKQVTKWAGFSFWDLSATADGRRLAFVKSGSQADVYVGNIDTRGAKLADVRRLTLNEHDDWPSAWTADGEILFYSDRDGKFDIFRQKPTAEQAEQVFSNSENKLKPEPTADGKWLLYWQSNAKNPEPTKRLMMMNVAAGRVSPLLEARPSAEFHCARAKQFCAMAEADPAKKEAVFSRIEIGSGATTEAARAPWSGAGELVWNLAADGSAIAVADVQDKGTTLRVITLPGGKLSDYPLKEATVTGIASVRNGWLLTSASLRGNEMLYLDPAGSVQPWWKSSSPLSAPVISADGRRVAFGLVSQESNAWLLEQK